MNTIAAHANRGHPVAGMFEITLAQFVAAGNVVNIDLPVGAEIVGGSVTVRTAFNTTGTDTITIGDSGSANRYLAATSIKSAARTALTLTGFKATTNNLIVARTPADSAATAGTLEIYVQYWSPKFNGVISQG